MNGINPTTGTVHSGHQAKAFGIEHLMQDCGTAIMTQRTALVATEEPLTCKRCIAAAARKEAAKATAAAKPAPARKPSSGPVTWGVFNAAGDLRCFRSTRREALAVATEGETVSKI